MKILAVVLSALLVAAAGGLVLLARHTSQPIDAVAVEPPKLQADPARIEATVRHLCGAGSHSSRDVAALDGIAAWLTESMKGLGLSPREQAFPLDGATYRNVLASIGPDTPERIVVAAHYDAEGPHPGADDNASGVAGVLELARLLAADPPPIHVEIAFYSLEEVGHFTPRSACRGSKVHADALVAEGKRVRAMFSAEMLGFFTDLPDSQRFPAPGLGLVYPTVGNFIAVVGRDGQEELVRTVKRAMRSASTLPVESITAPPKLQGIDFSDHRSFWAHDLPAVMITDSAFFRNANYHRASDTPETLDFKRMALVVDGLQQAVRALSGPAPNSR